MDMIGLFHSYKEAIRKGVSPQQAIQLASKYNNAIEYDNKAQAPHFTYRDEKEKNMRFGSRTLDQFSKI